MSIRARARRRPRSLCVGLLRRMGIPVMILFDRSEGETSAFLEYEQEHEHEALFPTGSSYFQRPVSAQRRIPGM